MKRTLKPLALGFAKLTSLTPLAVTDMLVSIVARPIYWMANRNHQAILDDYRRSLPDFEGAKSKWRPIRKMYRAYLRNGIDGLYVLGASKGRLRNRFGGADVKPLKLLLSANGEKKKGAIVAFPHMAAFGTQGVILALNGIPVTIVGNKQRWPLGLLMERVMAKCDIEFVPIARGDSSASTTALSSGSPTELMQEAVNRGRVVLIAGDYLSPLKRNQGRGVRVDFVGQEREVGVGCALVALRANVPVIGGAVLQRRSKRTLVWTDEIPPKDVNTDELTKEELSKHIQPFMQEVADRITELVALQSNAWYIFGDMVSYPNGRKSPATTAPGVSKPKPGIETTREEPTLLGGAAGGERKRDASTAPTEQVDPSRQADPMEHVQTRPEQGAAPPGITLL